MVISHHRAGNYSFHAFLFNKCTNSKSPLDHQDSNKKNKHWALSLTKKCLGLQTRFRICTECCTFGSQGKLGRELRTKCGQPGWGEQTSGQSHSSAHLFSLLAGLGHYVSALMGFWEGP